jgi:hypothetical protein
MDPVEQAQLMLAMQLPRVSQGVAGQGQQQGAIHV